MKINENIKNTKHKGKYLNISELLVEFVEFVRFPHGPFKQVAGFISTIKGLTQADTCVALSITPFIVFFDVLRRDRTLLSDNAHPFLLYKINNL
jgi:hypothetical protein